MLRWIFRRGGWPNRVVLKFFRIAEYMLNREWEDIAHPMVFPQRAIRGDTVGVVIDGVRHYKVVEQSVVFRSNDDLANYVMGK